MINLKPDVVAALKTVATTYYFYPPNEPEYPLITYHEVQNNGSYYADNTVLGYDIGFGITAWCEGSTSELVNQVEQAMLQLGFFCDMCVDGAPENGANVKHMRFITKQEV